MTRLTTWVRPCSAAVHADNRRILTVIREQEDEIAQLNEAVEFKDRQLHELRAEMTAARGEHAREVQTLRDHRDDARIKSNMIQGMLDSAEKINDELMAANHALLETNEDLRRRLARPNNGRKPKLVAAAVALLAVIVSCDPVLADLPTDTEIYGLDDGDTCPADPSPVLYTDGGVAI